MKHIKEWASSILQEYTYLWKDSSLYVLITSMLTCLVHIWRNYATDTAGAFTVLIINGMILVLYAAYTLEEQLYFYANRKAVAFRVDTSLMFLGVLACCINLRLAFVVIVMAFFPQFLIAFKFTPREDRRQVSVVMQNIVRALTLLTVTGGLLYEWLSVDVSNVVKVGAVVVYVLLIPVIIWCQDKLYTHIYEVVNPW